MWKKISTIKPEGTKVPAPIRKSETAYLLLFALLIWLFGNLVFVPIAESLNWQTGIFVTLIFFAAFTFLVIRAIPKVKKFIDTTSIIPARKYLMKRGLNRPESIFISRQIMYMISIIILYLLYLPFLWNFHPAVAGIALIFVVIWIFFGIIRIISTASQNISEWLKK